MTTRGIAGALLAGCLIFASAPWAAVVSAWEEDVHYVLTFWLATRAGFARNDADQIAQADQSYDDSEHAGAIPTVIWIILREDMGAARDLQLKHFPTDAALPSPPLRRVVSPNAPSARRAVNAAMSGGDSGTALATLGEGLHPFQDSWSHQGVPDIPFNLRPNLISAHPASRGGWRSHDADLTHLHAEDTVNMARETYAVLTEFLNRNPKYRREASVPWPQLEPTVRVFASARTREAKAEWATREVPEAKSDRTSSAAASTGRVRMRALPPPLSGQSDGRPRLTAEAQAALLQAGNEFLRQWLELRNVQSATTWLNLEELARQFSADDRLVSASDVEAWCRRFLAIQLVDDHDAVNRAGHGDPRHERYRELPTGPLPTGQFRATRTVEAPMLSGRDFLSTDVAGGTAFALVLQSDNSLRDTITIVWRQDATKWSIVRLFAFVE